MTYICKYCGKTFTALKKLQNHLNRVSPCNTTFMCKICNKTFKTIKSFNKHKSKQCKIYKYNEEINRLLYNKDIIINQFDKSIVNNELLKRKNTLLESNYAELEKKYIQLQNKLLLQENKLLKEDNGVKKLLIKKDIADNTFTLGNKKLEVKEKISNNNIIIEDKKIDRIHTHLNIEEIRNTRQLNKNSGKLALEEERTKREITYLNKKTEINNINNGTITYDNSVKINLKINYVGVENMDLKLYNDSKIAKLCDTIRENRDKSIYYHVIKYLLKMDKHCPIGIFLKDFEKSLYDILHEDMWKVVKYDNSVLEKSLKTNYANLLDFLIQDKLGKLDFEIQNECSQSKLYVDNSKQNFEKTLKNYVQDISTELQQYYDTRIKKNN